MSLSWTPEKHDGDNWIVRHKVVDASLVVNMGNGQPPNNLFAALIGSEFRTTINTREGKVVRVEGREAMLRKLAAANPQVNAKAVLEQILTDRMLADFAKSAFATIPTKEVRRGSEWKSHGILDRGALGKYLNVSSYTYKGQDEVKCLDKIKVETTATFKGAIPDGGGDEAVGTPALGAALQY